MQRSSAEVVRLTLPRRAPLVPCTYAVGRRDRWNRELTGCGALIPYRPNKPCPGCGQVQARAHAPAPTAASRVITGDTAIVDAASGDVVVVYVVNAVAIADALAVSLRGVTFDQDVYHNVNTTTRLSGMAVTHRTFGYQPPVVLRRRYGCCRSQFNAEHPEAMARLTEFCRLAETTFRRHAPDVHDATARKVWNTIAPAWLIGGTPWSSGIINQTAALPYHRDRANVAGSWSAQIASRRHVEGGLLHLADYDVYLPIEHGSLTIFDGQSVVHGVTPMRMTGPAPYRYTAVAYAKTAMGRCCPDPAQEARRAQRVATEAEEARRTRVLRR